MAITHHKPEPATTQTQDTRHYTVGYVPNGGYDNPAPAINLKGRWLQKAGFTRGTPVMVTVTGQHLVITRLPRQSLLNNMMEKAGHLSPEMRQELAQIVKGLMVHDNAGSYGDRAAKREGEA